MKNYPEISLKREKEAKARKLIISEIRKGNVYQAGVLIENLKGSL